LVKAELLDLEGIEGSAILQGYLHVGEHLSIRVRIKGEKAFLTIKGKAEGPVRSEFEYPIPLEDARQLMEKCEGHLIEKTRYLLPYQGQTWEVDVFAGANEGLVLAELELEQIDQEVKLPEWIAEEVTEDTRYYNPYLALNPYKIRK